MTTANRDYPVTTASRPGMARARALAVAVALIGGLGLAAVATAPPAVAAPTTWYAYATGAATPAGCPLEATPAEGCSLATALSEAAAGDTVALATPGATAHYVGNWTVATASTSPSTPLTIEPASGVSDPTLDGNHGNAAGCTTAACNSSVLDLNAGVSITIASLTIENGDNTTPGASGFEDGGAIDSGDGVAGGTVVVSDTTFSDNAAGVFNDFTGYGGAIDNGDRGGTGSMAISDSIFSGNTGGVDGGAIDNGDNGGTGTVTVSGSTFSGNGALFAGGAIDNGENGGGGMVTVSDAAFSGNIAFDGGAIDNGDNGGTGTVSVSDSTLSGNTAPEDGGAIDNGDEGGRGTLSVSDSTFSSNNAFSSNGGAIDNGDNTGTGTMSVSDSTFSANSTQSEDGGAINSSNGTVSVSDSTFSANSALNLFGGAINLINGTLSVSDSTFSANSAQDNGGAINLSNGTLSVWDSTFSANSTQGGSGGAIFGTGPVWLAGNILAGNSFPGLCSQSGAWNDEGYNVGSDTSCFSGSAPGDTDAGSSLAGQLGPLADNGGPTETIAPLPGNPARGLVPDPTSVTLNDASVALCPTVDQRGVASAAGQACDAGAVQLAAGSVTFTSSDATATVGSTYTVTTTSNSGGAVTLTIDASTSSACSISGATVTFTAAGNCQIDASLAATDLYTAAGATQLIVTAQAQSITFTTTAPATAPMGTSYTVGATATSGLPVTFSTTSAATVCTVGGSTVGGGVSQATVTFTGPGACVIDADQAGNTNYTAAPQVTQTVTVVAPAGLTAAFNPSQVPFGATSTLTFTVTNPNAGTTLTGIEFTDTLPTGLLVSTPTGQTTTCPNATATFFGSSEFELTGATLVAGATCTFSVNVTGTAAGTYNNVTSIVASDNGGFGPDAMASITVEAGPVMIAKSFGALSIPLNGSTTLSFTITNMTANGNESGIAFTDSLPSGLVVSNPNGLTGICGGGTITATAGSSAVSLTGASLTGGASCTFQVKVTSTTAGVKNNSVTVSSTTGGTGNTAMASVTVVAPPTLTKSFGAPSVALNGSTTLTFTIGNPNSTTLLTDVGFTDELPSGLVVATPNGGSATCDGTATAVAGSSSISVSGVLLAAGSTCTISFNVTGTTAGSTINMTSPIASFNGGSGSAAVAALVVVAPPVIAKVFGAPGVAPNGTTSLTLTLTNPAANTDAVNGPEQGVSFTDTFPSGLVIATPSNAASTCADAHITANAGASTVTASTILIPVGGSCTISLNVTGTTPGLKTNSVTISSTNGGTGNTATAQLQVGGPVMITKAFGAATMALNGSTSLTFMITNPAGNGPSTGIGFTDTLPVGLVVATPNGLNGTCNSDVPTATAGASTVTLSGATLNDGASCTFSVNVTATAPGVKTNSVLVSSTNAGAGNTATASVTVVAPPTLSKAFGAPSIPFGGSTALTFTVANPNSTVALSGVAFTDTLPAGLTVSSPNGESGTCGGGTITAIAGSNTVTLSGATIAASGNCTFAVNVTAISVGTTDNTTSKVTSTNGGTGLTATATLDVTKAPTTTTVTVSPSSPSFGSPVTFTATVAPSGANGSGVHPTGTVSFYLNGGAAPIAVVPLTAGRANFTTAGLGAGTNTVTASYSGDTDFLASSSTTQATVMVTCTTTITGNHAGSLVLGPGSICVLNATVSGSITAGSGTALEVENTTVSGAVTATGSRAPVRVCGSSASSVSVENDTSFVVVGDSPDGCAPNTLSGSLTLIGNSGGVQAIGNTVQGAVTASANSGAGPFPNDSAPTITGNKR